MSTNDQPKRNSIDIMHDAPLFAGLEDLIQFKPPKKEKTPQAAKTKEKKKPAARTKKVTEKVKARKPQTAKKVQPLEPDAILLSVAEMCKLLKISRATLVRMDNAGKVPGRMKLGGSVRFHRQTVETWLQSLIPPAPVP